MNIIQYVWDVNACPGSHEVNFLAELRVWRGHDRWRSSTRRDQLGDATHAPFSRACITRCGCRMRCIGLDGCDSFALLWKFDWSVVIMPRPRAWCTGSPHEMSHQNSMLICLEKRKQRATFGNCVFKSDQNCPQAISHLRCAVQVFGYLSFSRRIWFKCVLSVFLASFCHRPHPTSNHINVPKSSEGINLSSREGSSNKM